MDKRGVDESLLDRMGLAGGGMFQHESERSRSNSLIRQVASEQKGASRIRIEEQMPELGGSARHSQEEDGV